MDTDHPYMCVWKVMSYNPKSTTFQDVKEGSPLYRCKNYCEGYGSYKEKGEWVECRAYYPIMKIKKRTF